MNGVVPLLDPQTQSHMRQVLDEHGLGQFADMLDETLAALTVLGQHPTTLRAATLTIMPITARSELDARRLVECHDADRVAWTLTAKGEELAGVLAAAAPELSESDRRQAAEALESIVADANKELGLND